MNSPPPDNEPSAPIAPNRRGSGKVPVGDDEETVRIPVVRMIACFGFHARQADSRQHALDLLREDGSHFGLVLLDLTMPDMDGFATFTAIRPLRPEQPIVVFSSYGAQDARPRSAGQNLNGFLPKSFSVGSLRAILRQFSRK